MYLNAANLKPGGHFKINNRSNPSCRLWPDLKVLCIGGEGVTANGLILTAKLCQNLQILELDRSPPLTKKIVEAMTYVGLRKLQLIELNHTSITTEVCSISVKYIASLTSQLRYVVFVLKI